MTMYKLITTRWAEIQEAAKAYGLPTEQDELVEILEKEPEEGAAPLEFYNRVSFEHGWLVGVADACDDTITGILDGAGL